MEKKGTLRTFSKRLLAIGLMLVVLFTAWAAWIQTNGGTVTVKQLSIVTDECNVIKAVMYLPDGVSKDNPAPGIFAVHGGNSSRYSMSNLAHEFARRGYVVVSLDQSCNGQSDRGVNNFFGTEDVMKYITTLEFVDQTKLGVMGHSMGNTVASMAEANLQFGVKAAMTLGSGAMTATDTPINVCVMVGTSDENTGPRGADSAVRGPVDYPKSMALAKFMNLPAGGEIASGTETGSREDNTLRKYLQPRCGHLGLLFSSEAIAMALTFMGDILGVDYALDVTSQTWILREIATAIAFIGLFVTLIGALGLMMTREKKPQLALETPADGHATANASYWIGLALMCVIPALGIQDLYMKGRAFFLAVSPTVFAMEHISGVIFWMLCTALAILAVNLLLKKLDKQYDWSFDKHILSIDGKGFGFTVKAAFLGVLLLYLLVYLAGFFGDVCIRLYNTEVHLFTRTRFCVFWAYLPLYLIYYIIIGYVQTSGLLCKGQAVWSQYLRTALVSIIGPALLLIVWYGSVGTSGINYLFQWRFVLGVLLNFLPGIAVGAILQVFCYRHTGKIWLGALTNAILFAWMATSIGVMLNPPV